MKFSGKDIYLVVSSGNGKIQVKLPNDTKNISPEVKNEELLISSDAMYHVGEFSSFE